MSTTERIYALLVEANPVPDPEALTRGTEVARPGLHVLDARRTTMQVEELTRTPDETPPRPPVWVAALAGAAVVVIAVIAGALVFADDGADEPAVNEATTTVAPEPESDVRGAAAIATVEAHLDALNAGDADAATDLLSLSGPRAEADRRMFEFNAVVQSAYPVQVDGCRRSGSNDEFVIVECDVTQTDPVMTALGMSQHVAPFHVYADGHTEWRPWTGVDLTALGQTYAGYLDAFHREAYLEVCLPGAYPFGSIHHNGVALTPECAELAMPLLDEIAAWVEAGKPES